MKKIAILTLCLFAGCSPMSPHQLVRELKNDPAIVLGKVIQAYEGGVSRYDRPKEVAA